MNRPAGESSIHRVLILGGGFGGVAAAHTLRARLAPDAEIIVADRRSYFMVGFRKSWGLVGSSPLEVGQAPLAALEQFGIRFVQGEITAIDGKNRAAVVGGQRIEADAVIVALGAVLSPEAVPGFEEYGYNVYDPSIIERAAASLRALTAGQIVIGIMGLPYKCPPAPYEMALLVREALTRRGVNPEITIFSPQPMSMPILGQAGCSMLDNRMSDYGITFLPNHKAVGVEADRVLFEEGDPLPFDLLFGVPRHRVPGVIMRAGFTPPDNWIKTNPETFETLFEGVYAVGDCTAYLMANGQPLPKAGVFAEAEGRIAAEHIAARLLGQGAPPPFDASGTCFLEVGGGEAMAATGNFLAQPGPQVALLDASPDLMRQKREFEAQRLLDWFGVTLPA